MSTPVEKIKEKLNIADLIGEYVKLDRTGSSLKGKCPFHNEKTPSFFVSPDRGTYYCFGCNAKGDIFSFVQQFEGLDFMGALKLLAQKAGVELTFEKSESKDTRERMLAVMEAATDFFQSRLKTNSEARAYIHSRGLTDATIEHFRIGYAPNEWRSLYTHLKTLKFSDIELEQAGLVKRPEKAEGGSGKAIGRGEEPRPYDRFRDRIIFPISDSSGRVIAFSGRIVHDDGKSAKYLNSPDTILFKKSEVLFGIDKAKTEIRARNYTILVEGQMDLTLSHQAGIKNTVAVSGTALKDSVVTEENVVNNLGIVRRLSPNIILAFDSDKAGRNAAMRSAQIALSLGMEVKIADLPEGKDPADLVLADKEQWKQVLREAKHVIDFELDTVVKSVAKRDLPKEIKTRVLPYIARLDGAMQRDQYVRKIHDVAGLGEDAIREDLKDVISKQAKAITSGTPSSSTFVTQAKQKFDKQDAILRHLFGVVFFLEEKKERKDIFNIDPMNLRSELERILGASYSDLSAQFGLRTSELILEAEARFGDPAAAKGFKASVEELLLNLEEDILKLKFTETMVALSGAERDKDASKATELLNMCKDLTEKMREISTRKSAKIF
ncbi:MAG: DNA primase [Candidatus Taylorbacteria bacterium]|nr:DNA primase [Candidatus Taylorbacteria bacterium]